MLLLVFAAGVGVETIEYDGGTYTGELVDRVPYGPRHLGCFDRTKVRQWRKGLSTVEWQSNR
jgi:hypothetical protein